MARWHKVRCKQCGEKYDVNHYGLQRCPHCNYEQYD